MKNVKSLGIATRETSEACTNIFLAVETLDINGLQNYSVWKGSDGSHPPLPSIPLKHFRTSSKLVFPKSYVAGGRHKMAQVVAPEGVAAAIVGVELAIALLFIVVAKVVLGGTSSRHTMHRV